MWQLRLTSGGFLEHGAKPDPEVGPELRAESDFGHEFRRKSSDMSQPTANPSSRVTSHYMGEKTEAECSRELGGWIFKWSLT